MLISCKRVPLKIAMVSVSHLKRENIQGRQTLISKEQWSCCNLYFALECGRLSEDEHNLLVLKGVVHTCNWTYCKNQRSDRYLGLN